MKTAVALAFPALALGYAGIPNAVNEKRQALSGVTGALGEVGTGVGDLEGLLGSVAASVDPDNYRPEAGYTFQAPGPNDSRGPCPGLNLLANYGYLPRDGHVSLSQVVPAVARGFNMGTDLATILAVFAILTDGDPIAQTWYLGSGTNGVGGLNRHSTVEADVSPNREDFYNACGDNHHLSSRIFKNNVALVREDANKEFSYDVMAKHYGENARFSQQYNPWIYYFPFPSIVSVVAFNFYPEFFSNGTYGAGGVANYESIASIIGANYSESTGNYEYVPERWPEQGWYRRATEYDAVTALADGFTRIYPADPIAMPFGQIGTPNLNPSTILCDIYQGLNSITPLAIAGDSEEAQQAVTGLISMVAGVLPAGTIDGCPTDSLSANYLYQNASTAGGPLGPSLNIENNAGNNVYNKVYFTEAPEQPDCSYVQ